MNRLLTAFLLIFTLTFTIQSFAQASEAEKLHQLFDDEWAQGLKDSPVFATYLGVSDYNDHLGCATEACYQEQKANDEAFLARLETIDRSQLKSDDQVNYDLFKFNLESRVNQANYRTWRIPFLNDYGFWDTITGLPTSMPFKTVKDYENYISRLKDVPRYMGEEIQNMRNGLAEGFTQPKVVLGRVIPAVAVQVFSNPFETPYFGPFENFPSHFPSEDKQRLLEEGTAAISASVIPSFKTLHTFLVEEYEPITRTEIGANTMPGGAEYYDMLVKYYTTQDLTAAEVHEIGLSEVARIRGEMEEIIEKLGFEGSFADFLEFLRTDPQFYAESPRQLLAEASYHAKRIDGKMPEFFKTLPRLSYGVRAVPDEIAPAYTTGRYWGGNYEQGRAGNYMVNTYALDKRPLYNLPSLTLHEGVPGHHHQIALSQELQNVPMFRKNTYLSAFGEGWGLYCEKLGVEMEIYEDDYQHFGRLTYEMWRAGRLVVDTGMHAMGWTRDQAVQLFIENSALSEHNINTEVDRYISWPGQALAYKMGELKIWELRRKAEAALGEKFDIREFHDAVLLNGSVPHSILEAKIEEYIKANQ